MCGYQIFSSKKHFKDFNISCVHACMCLHLCLQVCVCALRACV